ncbi:MAG: hypothetical protein AAF458_22485 [Pseudomonadota bacterium]
MQGLDSGSARLLAHDAVGAVNQPLTHAMHLVVMASIALAHLSPSAICLAMLACVLHWSVILRRLEVISGFWVGAGGLRALSLCDGRRAEVDGRIDVFVYGPLRVLRIPADGRVWWTTLALQGRVRTGQRQLLAAAAVSGTHPEVKASAGDNR